MAKLHNRRVLGFAVNQAVRVVMTSSARDAAAGAAVLFTMVLPFLIREVPAIATSSVSGHG